MKRRIFFRNIVAGAAGIYSLRQPIIAQQVKQETKPDILIYLSDDHSLRDCSVYGASDIPTPHMEKLAEAGLKLNRAFIASPDCAPSLGALMTGLMPARNGAERNHTHPSRAHDVIKQEVTKYLLPTLVDMVGDPYPVNQPETYKPGKFIN